MLSIEQLLYYNGHIGSSTTKFNSQMGLFIYGQMGHLMIFDLRISILFLRRSISVLRILNLNVARRQVIFVGCHFSIDNFLKNANNFFDYTFEPFFGNFKLKPYFLMSNWLRGCFSNFKKLRKFVCYIKLILAFAKKYKKEYKEYISGERFDKPFWALRASSYLRKRWTLMIGGRFAGLDTVEFFPSFAINFKLSNKVWFTAECAAVDLPNISIVDSFIDPRGVSFPVPGNENSIQYLYLILFLFISNIKISLLSYYLKFFSQILLEFEKYPQNIKYGFVIKKDKFAPLLKFFNYSKPLSGFISNFYLNFRDIRKATFYLKIKKIFFHFYFNTLLNRDSNSSGNILLNRYKIYFLISVQFSTLPILVLRKLFTKISHFYRGLKCSINFSYKKYCFYFEDFLDSKFNSVKTINELLTKNDSWLVYRRARFSKPLTKQQRYYFLKKFQNKNFSNYKGIGSLKIFRSLSLQQLRYFLPSRFSFHPFFSKVKNVFFSEYSLKKESNFKRRRRRHKFFIGRLRYKYIRSLSLRQFIPPKFFKKHIKLSRKIIKSFRLVLAAPFYSHFFSTSKYTNFFFKVRLQRRFRRRLKLRHRLIFKYFRKSFTFRFLRQKFKFQRIARIYNSVPFHYSELFNVRPRFFQTQDEKEEAKGKTPFIITRYEDDTNHKLTYFPNKLPAYKRLKHSFSLCSHSILHKYHSYTLDKCDFFYKKNFGVSLYRREVRSCRKYEIKRLEAKEKFRALKKLVKELDRQEKKEQLLEIKRAKKKAERLEALRAQKAKDALNTPVNTNNQPSVVDLPSSPTLINKDVIVNSSVSEKSPNIVDSTIKSQIYEEDALQKMDNQTELTDEIQEENLDQFSQNETNSQENDVLPKNYISAFLEPFEDEIKYRDELAKQTPVDKKDEDDIEISDVSDFEMPPSPESDTSDDSDWEDFSDVSELSDYTESDSSDDSDLEESSFADPLQAKAFFFSRKVLRRYGVSTKFALILSKNRRILNFLKKFPIRKRHGCRKLLRVLKKRMPPSKFIFLAKKEFLFPILNSNNYQRIHSQVFFPRYSKRRTNFNLFYNLTKENAYQKALLSLRFLASSYLHSSSFNRVFQRSFKNRHRASKWDIAFRRSARPQAKYFPIYSLRRRRRSHLFFKHKLFPRAFPASAKLSKVLFRMLKLITLFFILRKIKNN